MDVRCEDVPVKWTHIVWDPSPGGNVQHVEENDVTTDEVEEGVSNTS